MIGLETLFQLIKEYGLTMVLLGYFIFLYVQNNKDTLSLVISFKDETSKMSQEHKDAIYVLKDEVKDEISKSINALVEALKNNQVELKSDIKGDVGNLRDDIRGIEDKVGRIEMMLIIKRGDDK